MVKISPKCNQGERGPRAKKNANVIYGRSLEVDVLQVGVEAAVEDGDGHLSGGGAVPPQPGLQQGEDLVQRRLLHLLP